ncbi:hypothetical protein HKCCE3408_11295 [Rhodobacterales bacterium HKCCE3408]|nr:hypothetical protein [Rhodobacterales bacterium HKCCE3408]
MTGDRTSGSRVRVGRLILRIVLFLLFLILATWVAHLVREALALEVMPANEQMVHRAIILGSVAYVGLLALPFMPGAEIGIAMLTAFGAAIAPLVYLATVFAMLLSYTLGRLLPVTVLARILASLRLRRAAVMVARTAPLSREARLELLLAGAPPRTVALALRHRYAALALLVNVPGNAIIGGGGGIMMMAGLSGLFAPAPTAIAVAMAVSPVPLAFILLGA